MNCQEFWNEMPERTHPGEGPGAEGSEHLRECPHCAARLKRQRAMAAGLRMVAAELRCLEAPTRVETRLRAAFRGQPGLAVGHPAGRWWAPLVTWAAAAALVAALALFLVRGRQPAPAGSPPHRSAPGVLQWAGTDLESPSVGDGFIPLPNVDPISPTEDFDLVRVEVPRSAMIALGFSVSAERASEPVEAEFALGSDGLARAVRLIE